MSIADEMRMISRENGTDYVQDAYENESNPQGKLNTLRKTSDSLRISKCVLNI